MHMANELALSSNGEWQGYNVFNTINIDFEQKKKKKT